MPTQPPDGTLSLGHLADDDVRALTSETLSPESKAAALAHLSGCRLCRERVHPQADPDHTPVVVSLPFTMSVEVLKRGSVLGRYVVLDVLGAGGMGEVYAAIDPELDRRVALKLVKGLDDSGSTAGGNSQTRLLREAQAMAKLSHPNVVSVYDVGVVSGRVFLAMELVRGHTLTQWLATSPRGWQQVVQVFKEAGQGVAAAHGTGIVHRDFKLDNVLVGDDGRVRVSDFGLARASLEAEPSGASPSSGSLLSVEMTRAAMVLGTPAYMAPEQWEGRAGDTQSDQFSFCVALYRALYGQPPFASSEGLTLEQAVKGGQVTSPPPKSRVPAWLHRIVLRGLSVTPTKRFASMEALLAELSNDPSRARSTRLAWLGFAAALLCVIAGTSAFLSRNNRQCLGGEAKLAGIWDEPRRTAIETAFQKTGLPYASDAWKGVARALDVYSREWVAARTEACEATWIRKEQTDSALSLRMHCLNERLDELRSLTDVLINADAASVRAAPKAPSALTEISACSDLAALERRMPLPKNPEARLEIERVQHELNEAAAAHVTGHYKDAAPKLERVAEEARALQFPSLQAEVASWLIKSNGSSGHLDRIEGLAFDTIRFAEVSGIDALRFEGLLALAHLAEVLGASLEDALTYATLAEGLLPLIKDNDLQRVKLNDMIGNIYVLRGHIDEGQAAYQRAFDIAEHTTSDLREAKSVPAENLAYVESTRHRYRASLEQYQRALVEREKITGSQHPEIASLLGGIAENHLFLNECELATPMLERARAIQVAGAGEATVLVADIDASFSRAMSCKGQLQEGERLARQSVASFDALAPQNPLKIKALLAAGENLLAQGRPKEALGFLEQAKALTLKLGADALEPTTDEGLAMVALERWAEAQKILEAALALQQKDVSPDRAMASRLHFALARVRWAQGHDKPGARALATAALKHAHDAEGNWLGEIASIEQWLGTHR